jgi:hypothetical protein
VLLINSYVRNSGDIEMNKSTPANVFLNRTLGQLSRRRTVRSAKAEGQKEGIEDTIDLMKARENAIIRQLPISARNKLKLRKALAACGLVLGNARQNFDI